MAKSRKMLAELAAICAPARCAALRFRPRSLSELMAAAGSLDVDLVACPQLSFLVDTILCCEQLPVGWERTTARQAVRLGVEPPFHRLSLEQHMRQGTRAQSGEPARFFVSHLSLNSTELHPVAELVHTLAGQLLVPHPQH